MAAPIFFDLFSVAWVYVLSFVLCMCVCLVLFCYSFAFSMQETLRYVDRRNCVTVHFHL